VVSIDSNPLLLGRRRRNDYLDRPSTRLVHPNKATPKLILSGQGGDRRNVGTGQHERSGVVAAEHKEALGDVEPIDQVGRNEVSRRSIRVLSSPYERPFGELRRPKPKSSPLQPPNELPAGALLGTEFDRA